MRSEFVTCPVCRNCQVEVMFSYDSGMAVLEDSDSVCECGTSKLVDTEKYKELILTEANEKDA